MKEVEDKNKYSYALKNELNDYYNGNKMFYCPAVVAWFAKASVFHSVNSAPSANHGSNPI